MALEKEKGSDTDVEDGISSTAQPTQTSRLSQLAELVRSISNQDAEQRYREEAADNRIPDDTDQDDANGDDTEGSSGEDLHREETKVVIAWEENDEENPHNWSKRRKLCVLFIAMVLINNSTLGSSLPSMAIPTMMKQWGVEIQEQKALPISCFLIGYVLGPILWGPLSEQYGRRNLSLFTFVMFLAWTLGCALSPNWAAIIIFRFLAGCFASSPIAIVPGLLVDIYDDPIERGRSFAWFTAMTLTGPLFAPIIAGYCTETIGWRWTFWVGLIYAGFTFLCMVFLPETYAPALLAKRARKLRKESPGMQVYAASELEERDLMSIMTRVLTRPLRMLITEMIVSSACTYLALVYGIYYMSFQAWPIIFEQLYGLSLGVTGLCFLPVGGGAFVSLGIYFWYDGYLARAKKQNKAWAFREECRRVPLACIGGPLFVVALFWLGWTARASIPFWVPMLAGVPFGMGFMLIFMALVNYLTDAYEIFAASANAASSATRSVLAVVLPLATTPMFSRLGIAGACSLLAGLSVLMVPIPFIFVWKGVQIRERSKFCIKLKQQKAENAMKTEKYRQRKLRKEAERSREEQMLQDEATA